MSNSPQPSYIGLGLAFGMGALALLLPVLFILALAELDATSPALVGRAFLEAAGLALFLAALAGTFLTVLLMRLRRFPWRALRYAPAKVAASHGVASVCLGIAGFAGGSPAAAMLAVVLAVLAGPVIYRRIIL